MNAQSNHPINVTTDPQFLGPEAGQQAGGKEGENAREVQAHELGDMRTILHIALTQPGVMNQAYRAFHNYSIGNQMLAALQLQRDVVQHVDGTEGFVDPAQGKDGGRHLLPPFLGA